MATIEHVAELFQERIEHDAPKQMETARDIWSELPLNFFYLTHADDTVDIVVTSIAQKVAQEDGISIPGFAMKNLQALVGPKTLVKNAIRLVFLTAFQPPSS